MFVMKGKFKEYISKALTFENTKHTEISYLQQQKTQSGTVTV